MKKKTHLSSRRTYALACPAFFFTLSFWSLTFLLSTSIYFFTQHPSAEITTHIPHLISRVPFTTPSIQDTPQCPENTRLLFSFNLPAVSASTCFRSSSDTSSIEVSSSWWKCHSGLYRNYAPFEQTSASMLWNIGSKFLCVRDLETPLGDFEYQMGVSSGLEGSSGQAEVV